VHRGIPVCRAIAQSFTPAAMSRGTVSNSSADRMLYAPLAVMNPS
jgi:hypothetical protein